MIEKAIQLGVTESLVGIVTLPSDLHDGQSVAIVLLNAGLLHKVGPHRAYVKIARHFADKGFLCLRFDLSGLGDSSTGNSTHAIRDRAVLEVKSALDYLQEKHSINKFVLLGWCSGALNAVKTAVFDERVIGTILINLRARHMRRYFLRNYFFNKQNILRILSKGVNPKFVAKKLINLARKSSAQSVSSIHANEGDFFIDAKDLQSLIQKDIKSLIICSQWDPSADYMYSLLKKIYAETKNSSVISAVVVPGANHMFNQLQHQQMLIDKISTWLNNSILNEADASHKFRKYHRKFYKSLSFLSCVSPK